MIALAECRKALVAALTAEGFNVSHGDDLVPEGATVAHFVMAYHRTIAADARGGMAVAGTEVRLAIGRADEQSATERVDALMSTLWVALEAADGPWHSLIVQTARPDAPLRVGDSTYATAALILELYV